MLELVADLGGDEGVVVDLGELEEAALLVDGHVVLVALGEDEEGLVPEDDHAALVLDEGGEVVDDGVDDAVREGVLFVEEGAEEDRVGAAVGHLGDLHDARGRVEHGDAALGEHGRDDDGLLERAVAGLAEREQEALEEARGLVERLLDGHVVLKVELQIKLLIQVMTQLLGN